MHAEVLAGVANWSMVHAPGPDAFTAAERAVEYARMLGVRDTEMNARLTLGGLMVEAGDVTAGLAEMSEVKDRTVEYGISTIAGRAYVNLPDALESVGRSKEAVPVLEEGIAHAQKFGLLDTEAWIWGNLAETLYSLGRWDQAAEAGTKAEHVGQSAKPRGFHATLRAELALNRGDVAAAAGHLAAARGHFGSHDRAPQHDLPLARLAIGIAAAEGRLLDARAELARALEGGFPPGTQRYVWRMLLASAIAEADARDLPTVGPGRPEILERIRATAKPLATHVPLWQAYERWVRAELLRAEDGARADTWTEVVTDFEALERPYDLARVRHRLAEALLLSGEGGEVRERATQLLRLAHAAAEHLGACPLAVSTARLAQRARLSLTGVRPLNGGRSTTDGGADAGTPEDPARALGLTGRERDVLRLVSAGRTNRQIAEALFISPKTASVHVSNILGKLGVSGRGEAAAVAHRLGLFAADVSHVPTSG
ncbi:Helix-turn-helix transcriptional regulator OS=Streptomyces alboniger OX=132473 GN=CP975_25275 PE=4 SV=1 [Streptomyces alboniger]